MKLFRTWRIHIRVLTLTAVGLAAWATSGIAETDLTVTARAGLGLETAKIWCVQCHVVEPDGTGTAQGAAPTFNEVANRAGQTVEKTENWLIDPHPPMPDLLLAREDIRNLSLYILSLKRE